MSKDFNLLRKPVALVGAGLIGLGWAMVFARAGLDVRIYDKSAELVDVFLNDLDKSLDDLVAYELIGNKQSIVERITLHTTLQDVVDGVGYIQESVSERVCVKRTVYRQLEQCIGPDVIVGSSASGIPASEFTQGLAIAPRCLVAHPVNPPYLIPLVELVPSPGTDSLALDAVHALMDQVKQRPIRITREVNGFVLNRLQGALLREAWALFSEGYCSTSDIDSAVSKGLGLRWSFMGPFETIDLNAPGGINDYAQRFGELYYGISSERKDPKRWSKELIERVEKERRGALKVEGIKERSRWRDRQLMSLVVHHQNAQELGEGRDS